MRQQGGLHHRRQADFYLRHAEHRIVAGDVHVARGHHLKPGTQAETIDPRDDRHREIAQHLAHAMDQREEIARFRWVQFGEFVQVGTAHEGAIPRAGDHQHAQLRVVGQGGDSGYEASDLGVPKAVEPSRVLDGDRGDATVAMDPNCHA